MIKKELSVKTSYSDLHKKFWMFAKILMNIMEEDLNIIVGEL